MTRTRYEQRALELIYDGRIPDNAVAPPDLVQQLQEADERARNQRAYESMLEVLKEMEQTK